MRQAREAYTPYNAREAYILTCQTQPHPALCLSSSQVSLHCDLDARTHIALGEALAPLRDEGYLILCSGGVTHNLLELSFGSERVPAWASSYDNWVQDILMHEEHKSKHESYEDAWNSRNRRLAAWMDDSEGVQAAAVIAHPTPENYMALLVAAGETLEGRWH